MQTFDSLFPLCCHVSVGVPSTYYIYNTHLNSPHPPKQGLRPYLHPLILFTYQISIFVYPLGPVYNRPLKRGSSTALLTLFFAYTLRLPKTFELLKTYCCSYYTGFDSRIDGQSTAKTLLYKLIYFYSLKSYTFM